MSEQAQKIIDFSTQSTPQSTWEQQKDEPVLWYSRLQIYLSQGTGRSLKAAYLQEREKICLVKSGKPISQHVPGSWKQASIKFHWQERARLYDAHMVKGMTSIVLDSLGTGMANRLTRIKELDKIAKRIIAKCDKGEMYHNTEIAYYKQLQSIFADIRKEMDSLDKDLLEELASNEAGRFYASMESISQS